MEEVVRLQLRVAELMRFIDLVAKHPVPPPSGKRSFVGCSRWLLWPTPLSNGYH